LKPTDEVEPGDCPYCRGRCQWRWWRPVLPVNVWWWAATAFGAAMWTLFFWVVLELWRST
jgi:hypothetical protein